MQTFVLMDVNWACGDTRCFVHMAPERKVVYLLPASMVTEVPRQGGIHLACTPEYLRRHEEPVEQFLSRTVGGDWSSVRLSANYRGALRRLSDSKAAIGVCHRDMHLGNILIGDGMFRLLDFFDVAFDYAYTDVCRLQLSLLSCLASAKPQHTEDVIEAFIQALEGNSELQTAPTTVDAVRFMTQIKGEFEAGRRKSFKDTEYYSTLMLEAVHQAYYSVCTDRPVCSAWPRLLSWLETRVRTEQLAAAR